MLFEFVREHKKIHIALVVLYAVIFFVQLLLLSRIYELANFGDKSLVNCSYTFEISSVDVDTIKSFTKPDNCVDFCIGTRENRPGYVNAYISYVDGIDERRITEEKDRNFLEGVFETGQYLASETTTDLYDRSSFSDYEYIFYNDYRGTIKEKQEDLDKKLEENPIDDEEVRLTIHDIRYEDVFPMVLDTTFMTDTYQEKHAYRHNLVYCSVDNLFKMFPNEGRYILSFSFNHVLSKAEVQSLKSIVNQNFGAFTYYGPADVSKATREYLKDNAPLSLLLITLALFSVARLLDALFLSRKHEFDIMSLCGAKKLQIFGMWIIQMLLILFASVVVGTGLFAIVRFLDTLLVNFSGSMLFLITTNSAFFILVGLLISVFTYLLRRKAK